jgi:hypothetical protein
MPVDGFRFLRHCLRKSEAAAEVLRLRN